MKKVLLIMITAALFFSLTTTAFALEEKITFTYDNTVNGAYDIENFSMKNSAKTKVIYLESKLLDYLANKNINIHLEFLEGQSITIPAKALLTSIYTDAKNTEEPAQVRIQIKTNAYGYVNNYFDTPNMNAKGIYLQADTSFQINAWTTVAGKDKDEYTSFALPLTYTSGYAFNSQATGITEANLRYYFLPDVVSAVKNDKYDWQYLGGSVNTADDTIAIEFSKTGFYCAFSSKSHTSGNTGGTTNGGTTTTTSASGFSDMANNWSDANVAALKNLSVIKNEGSYFYPNQAITRAQFAAYLLRTLYLEEDLSAATQFTDLDTNKWYYKEVVSAVSQGLMSGRGNGIFAPDDKITRQEMAAMITRALNKMNKAPTVTGTEVSSFADAAKIASWAKPSACTVATAGIIGGKTGNLFAPSDNATKAEAAAILLRTYQYIYNK